MRAPTRNQDDKKTVVKDSKQRNPFYRLHVFFCLNERPEDHPRGCCAAKGSKDLRDYMKAKAKEMRLKRVRINTSGCLDRCELGPSVIVYPDGVWYTCKTTDDVDRILEDHIRDGGRVDHLLMP